MEAQFAEELKLLLDQAQALMDRPEGFPLINLRNILDDERLATIKRIYDSCTRDDCGNEDVDPDSGVEVQEQDLRPLRKKRKIGGEKKRVVLGGPADPWKRITNMPQLPALAEYICAHLSKYPDSQDAEKFLRTLTLSSKCGEYDSRDDLGNAFMARYSWTQQVERRNEQVYVLQLFNDLFWFDMMQILRPRGTGRVGDSMLQELRRFLAPLNFKQLGLEQDVVIANVGEWSIRGSKINKLCKLYGSGAILILHKQLSRSFLEGKFTASGPYFKGAVERLNVLKLKDYVKNTGADTLATRIRKLLVKPFQEAYNENNRT
ncbi:hypothetical protein COCC4DRAFT_149401 [Bipolaris maydis ATCC 48331]|uniref:Uncharacterized protein n=2 Tax=Cochliobolus heterostrophus TaxID=5016 RepID=M2U9J1_COCH5|nr:uncharacterized protein COCC4DRAFT_149401 [Bipolaris maydis ATCC 48331]EMD95249.1 hypothetical protein COCHEDRAFT_1211211 [Bipolaris maydis C5]KAH7551167.1 hypothetical protein BM1_10041 [Bipolaris maydis]ENI00861.1 hypothetical protein COCC4DRAFT_149401 [Bipolaris maydis ATCC 48331]KAJ5021866.1 hypothetical protein J3E73DRAFT_198665 [Bipolaris maydis]KAJ5055041.1 hypothetical protein J3E74DRAFT_295116 [Bipolaris maydis]